MIAVKDAVRAAFNFLHELYPDIPLSRLDLEEVELSDDDRVWWITLGFDRPAKPDLSPVNALQNFALGPQYERVYKILEIDAETGTPRAMKIRETATVT